MFWDGAFFVQGGESLAKNQCPCCGCLTIDEQAGWDICPVCFWEDDGALDGVGANHGISVEKGRENLKLFGAFLPELSAFTRKPYESEITDSYRKIVNNDREEIKMKWTSLN